MSLTLAATMQIYFLLYSGCLANKNQNYSGGTKSSIMPLTSPYWMKAPWIEASPTTPVQIIPSSASCIFGAC